MGMQHECRVAHVLQVTWGEEYDRDTRFHSFSPTVMPSQRQKGQILQFKVFLKTCLSCPVLYQDYKNIICFWRTTTA